MIGEKVFLCGERVLTRAVRTQLMSQRSCPALHRCTGLMEVFSYPIVHIPSSGGAVSFIRAPKNLRATVYSPRRVSELQVGFNQDWRY